MTAQGLFRALGHTPSKPAARVENDFYPTPRAPIDLFMRVEGGLLHDYGSTVWEPAAGDGAMLDPLRDHGLTVYGSDIAPRRADIIAMDLFDFGTPAAPCVVTNPPFNLCSMRGGRVRFIEYLLGRLGVPYAAMMLPAAWMFAASRHDFLRAFPVSRMIPITPRIDWDGRGAPAADHAWYVWDAGHVGPTVVTLPESAR